jgi:outer membrane protein OmpA-like peptidoglycan-associated protein
MSRFKDLLNDVRDGGREDPAHADFGAGGGHDPRFDEPGFEAPRSPPGLLHGAVVSGAALIVALGLVGSAVKSAGRRLEANASGNAQKVATAQEAEVAYCTPDFKTVLERVLHSCGLGTATERRGCKPADIKTFAAIDDADFNALFTPLKERGGVIMFDEGKDVLDEAGAKLLDERWFARQGARYFFVVARASKTGTPDQNRALSHRRANSVLMHLQQLGEESEEELNQRVGLLWLGNEFAQLSQDYCQWPRSREQAVCDEEAINRSAFVSWVDCRL